MLRLTDSIEPEAIARGSRRVTRSGRVPRSLASVQGDWRCGKERLVVIEQLAGSLASLLPLTIREASYTEDISLVLAGEGWAFSTVSAWRVIRGGVLAYGWSDARAADLVWDLCWQQIVSVTAQSQTMRGDPAFGLSTGERLEIFSDHPTDPWVFRLPGITYVGSPSDPRYSG